MELIERGCVPIETRVPLDYRGMHAGKPRTRPRAHMYWGHGNNSNGRLQGDRLNDFRKVREAIQQNYAMDQMQAELFTVALCHHVPAWITILTTPSGTSSNQWRIH